MPKALIKPFLPLLMLLGGGLSACATPVTVTGLSASGCSALIPQSWKDGVPGAYLPDDDSVGAWVAFGDAQTGRLEAANGRTRDAIDLTAACEARDRAAAAPRKGFFARLFD